MVADWLDRATNPHLQSTRMRTTAELREGFLSFFEEKGHLRRPSASLVPRADDHSTLLTTPGCSRRCRTSSAASRRPRR